MLRVYSELLAVRLLGLLAGLGLLALPLRAQVAAGTKLAPGVARAAGRAGSRQTVRVQVRDAAAFRQWAGLALPAMQVTGPAGASKLLTIRLASPAQLAAVAASPLVEFVDVPNRPAHDERLLNSADLTVNNLRAVQRRYPALTGQGLVVSIKENPLDPTDLDFRGRLLNTPAGTVIESAHASIMATLIAGGGNSGPAGEGAARQAGIASSSYANLLPDANADLTRLSVSVQNHSYGTGIENYYGLEALGYDQQARQLPALLHVFSAGNSGNLASPDGPYKGLAGVANLTGQFKMSKNSLAVGATDALGQVAPLSSRGPAYDGRVKPELVAYGDAGSSDASALGSGGALLVQQAYRDQTGTLPAAALVKAALINSARDVGRPEVDFVAGFGQLDALGAVRTVLEKRYRNGAVAQGQEQLFDLAVPAGTQQVKVTLTWTDPEAAANAAQALVNDLDLEVLGPGGSRWLPWTLSTYPSLDSLGRPARRAADHLNNVEQVTITLPAAGTYQVRVRGYAVPAGPQAFSLAYAVVAPGFEWLVPSALRNVRPAQTTLLRWSYAGPATAARLEYRPVGRAAWRLLGATVDPTQRTFAWAAPDTTTLAQVRCVIGSQAYVSDTFALARPLPVHVGYICPDATLLSWPATPGATQYQVYRLGATAPEPFRLVADTLLQVTPAQQAGPYFAVAPVLGGKLAERGATINLAEAGVRCYIRSFLPRFPIADTAQLLLSLGTLYQLQAVQLQRLGPAGFQTIQTLSPVARLTTTFTDPGATIGLNQYRVVGQTTTGRTFFSDTVAVQLVRRGELLVFPVPVVVGQALQVAGEPGVALLLGLYDALGRLVRTSRVEGALNPFDTSGLRPGVYLLRATPATGGGPARTRRVLLAN
ncbi:S8 family serine peptidase [Hymenobacter cheonanensis]|uniref:S8 family serine peptidase n=1 Tax=Hymenobacter sp. CA2-7 TaxID=3063993 RepID=UPI002712B9BF|nr:S8 family serine peptidase [Hymenobacter sp. CA2-7]MDO7885874.1 S8 family serine peptidase [Hymenobacter sp. CA2-7]